MSSIESPAFVTAESYHGGLDHQELAALGIRPEDTIDFSSNILPQGPSPLVRAAIAAAPLERYPDRECHELRAAIGKRYQVDANRVLVGNGCSELIQLVASSLLAPQKTVLVLGPTFSEYERASRLAAATVVEYRAEADANFRVSIAEIDELLQTHQLKMVWICNPNNPTGQLIAGEQLIRWIDRHPNVLFVVDESYIEFCQSAMSLITLSRDNLVVLRSMTKAYALAGIRLGFAVLPTELHEMLASRRVPWSVSGLAQVAGVAAIQDSAYYESALRSVLEEKALLINCLVEHGFQPLPSTTGYFLIAVKHASAVRRRLLSQGLVVRECSSFGIEDHLRIAVRDRAANARLLAALCDRDSKISSAPVRLESQEAFSANDNFVAHLHDLFRLRRDIRRFRSDPVPAAFLKRWIQSACLAPSVGLSQPWRFVSVNSADRRAAIVSEFEYQNELAAQSYADAAVSRKYRELKLAGLREAPEHLAVFVVPDPALGRGLGRSTMPESVAYSVVAAIQNLWLAARAEGVGVGWVSILRAESVKQILQVPDTWQLVAYLCIGWPQVESDEVPELQREGWEQRVEVESVWLER